MSELSTGTHSKVLGRVLNAVFAVFCLILIAIVIVILPFAFQPRSPRLPTRT